MIFFRRTKLKSVTQTIELLAGYHAVKIDEPAFIKKYLPLFQLQNILKGK